MMKKNYLLYNRDSVSDDLIFEQLGKLSNGKLKLSENHTLKSTGSLIGKLTRSNNKRQSNNHKKVQKDLSKKT